MIFKILDEALSNELYGIAVKKGNDAFMAEIEEALNELIADGTAAEISEEWFGSDRIYELSNFWHLHMWRRT